MTEMPRFKGKINSISSISLASFLSPPKTMSFSWKLDVTCIATQLLTPVTAPLT